ncbi:flagellar hook-length control protein FliK [Spartinivicinus ruber]|uniref:flagellar hook-length control protein FliK n=1 Tax=Spartinivicinus ruber TaxID=2683272 RepID=UPI0013D57C59|nr:flagellar hook-length control protein FliK [Spartinivicinus ruber]
MDTFLLNLGVAKQKPVKNQPEEPPVVNNQQAVAAADGKPFQKTLDKQRQNVATESNHEQPQSVKPHQQKTEATPIAKPTDDSNTELSLVEAISETEAFALLDKTLLLTTEQPSQQEGEQAEMDISTLMESTSSTSKRLKEVSEVKQESDQQTDPILSVLSEPSPFAEIMKKEGLLQFNWQDLAKAERGLSPHQTMPHQLLGNALADVKTQLLSGENSTALTTLLSPDKLNNQLGFMGLQVGVEQRLEFPLLNSVGQDNSQPHLPQFPALQFGSASVNVNSGQLAQPSVVASQLPLPMPHPNWGQQFSDRVVWLVQQGVKTAHIQLDPPDLGMVEVRVQVTQDQANVQFASHHASVRESIEAQLVRLREMFSQQGIDLVNVDVSNQQFSESNRQSGLHADAADDMDDELDETTTTGVDNNQQGIGLVDYFV